MRVAIYIFATLWTIVIAFVAIMSSELPTLIKVISCLFLGMTAGLASEELRRR